VRPFTSTISLEEARRRLSASVSAIERVERVGLGDAAGRVAAADVASPVDVPPFSRAAMDGYAVIADETSGASKNSPAMLRTIERIYAGRAPALSVVSGTCAEIATGAPLPVGADAVVMVEDTSTSRDQVQIFAAAASGQNVRARGGDIAAGTLVIHNGDELNPSRVGALAAVGRTHVDVYAKPRVAVLSTGDEVVEPGNPLGPGQIFDVNRFTLAAIVAANGGAAEPHHAADDSVHRLRQALDECLDADLVVFSGGSSVGERDLILDVLSASGGTLVFHGIAVKPGKPTAFARIRGKPFFGMPGNPTSCLSNAYILLVPFLRAMARLPPLVPQRVRLPLGRGIVSSAGRHQFYTVRLADGAAWPAFKGSGDITSMSEADGYIELTADQSILEQGAQVDVTLF
jgi:molybdopterin molybdotransferase